MNHLSVKTKLSLTMAIVFVVLAAGETFFAFRYFEGAYRNSVRHDLDLMTATLADGIDSRLAIAQSALGAAGAALPPAALEDPAAAQKFIDERVTLRNLFPRSVLVISRAGRLIAANGSRSIAAGQDFSRRDFFAATVSRKLPYLSAVSEQSEGGAEVIAALPLLGPDGEVRAVLAGVTDLSFSKSSIESLLREKIGATAHLYIAARDGTYLLHHGKPHGRGKIPAEQQGLFEVALAGQDATGETVDCDGEKTLASLQKLTRIDSVLMVSYPLALAYAPLEKAEVFFLVAIVFGTTVLLAVAWGMTTLITSPLRIMTSHVKALPDLPYGSRRLNLRRSDEIGTLAAAFDQLVVTLEERETELVNLSQKHRQRAVDLAAINRELEAFSSSLSHDLKSPLTGISLAAEELRDRLSEGCDDTVAVCLSTILAEGQRMNDLIDGMLLLSRASQAEMRYEEVDLSALAHDVLLRLSRSQPDRKVEWEIAPRVLVSGDGRLLQAALENLLGNAWKYTEGKEPARVEFGVLPGEEGTFFVKDNGAGFDMAGADRIFEPFRRLHGDSRFKGSGVGLATVQRIIQRHGGRIWANSAPGQGATFFFTLNDTCGAFQKESGASSAAGTSL